MWPGPSRNQGRDLVVKLVYCIRRREGISAVEFSHYWLQEHGPLVKSLAPIMGAIRYIQSHLLDSDLNESFREGRGLAEPYDGITEVWWASAEALASAMATPEGSEAAGRLLKDESRFIDFSSSRLFLTREHEIFDFDS
jgi:uncharacterized protein (TIGR02118 family)